MQSNHEEELRTELSFAVKILHEINLSSPVFEPPLRTVAPLKFQSTPSPKQLSPSSARQLRTIKESHRKQRVGSTSPDPPRNRRRSSTSMNTGGKCIIERRSDRCSWPNSEGTSGTGSRGARYGFRASGLLAYQAPTDDVHWNLHF